MSRNVYKYLEISTSIFLTKKAQGCFPQMSTHVCPHDCTQEHVRGSMPVYLDTPPRHPYATNIYHKYLAHNFILKDPPTHLIRIDKYTPARTCATSYLVFCFGISFFILTYKCPCATIQCTYACLAKCPCPS